MQIFADDDPKISVLKMFLKRKLIEKIEAGYEWFVITGQLGIEIWAAEVVVDLKKDYSIYLAVISPYENLSERWNEQNRFALAQILEEADYINATSHKNYESPKQLISNQRFLIKNTSGCFMIYDREFQGKTKYLDDMITKYMESYPYDYEVVQMEELEWFLQELMENHPEGLKCIVSMFS